MKKKRYFVKLSHEFATGEYYGKQDKQQIKNFNKHARESE